MKHDWKSYCPPQQKNKITMVGEYRRCQNCGAIQEKITEYLWMRVDRYRWWPLVGRCKPKGKERSDG